MDEHGFVRSIHRLLPPEVYVWKINDRYAGGVADAFYHGPDGKILFVEYKYLKKLPTKGKTILRTGLSSLQIEWLTQRQNAGLNVAVILGTPIGGVFITDIFTEVSCAEFKYIAKSKRELSQEIVEILGASSNAKATVKT